MSGTNAFNIGSDTVLTVIASGAIVAATILIDFEARQLTADLDSTAIDGANRYRHVEKGWDMSFGYDRGDSSLDDFFAAKEAGRYAGVAPPVITVTETTTNPDGSVSKYRFDGVTLKMDTIGSRKGDAKVEPKVSGKASRRVKVQ